MIHHIKRATRHLIFWSLLALAISLSLVRVLLLEVDNYKAYLATRVSELLDAQVSIGHLRANMRGFYPEVVLKDIALLSSTSGEKPTIQLKEIRLGINLLDALISRDSFASSRVTLVGVKLTVKRQRDGSIAIVGLKARDGQPLWLLQGGLYEVLQSEISWQDELNPHIPSVMGKGDVAIINHGEQHKLNLKMQLPADYGDELNLSMTIQGAIFEPRAINGKFYINAKNLHLAKWLVDVLPQAMAVKTGSGDAQLWGELQHSQLRSLAGDVQLQDLQLTRPERHNYTIKQLNSQFYWQHNNNQWRLDVPHLALTTADKQRLDTLFRVTGEQAQDQSLAKLGVFAKALDLQEIADLSQFFIPLPKATQTFLTEAKPKGSIEQLSFFADLKANHYAVNGLFKQLTLTPTATRAGINNLSGVLKGTEQQGQISFDSQNLRVESAGLFRDALDITQLKGTLTWQQTDTEWLIHTPLMTINSADISTQSKLSLSIPKTQGLSPFLDLHMIYTMPDMTKVPRYLPSRIMGKDLVTWLDHAFFKGSIPKGRLSFYGNLHDFPFTQGQGVFETRFDVEHLELSYNPDWPHLTETSGEVVFYQEGLQIAIDQGESQQVTIAQATVAIPNLNKSEQLLVQGQLNTMIPTGLAFMQKSTLHAPVDNFLAAVEPQGDTNVTLDLKLPLVQNAPTKVNGSATLTQAKLKVKALDLSVTKINGLLKFNENGIFSETIKAETLAQPIRINVKGADLNTRVLVSGQVGIAELSEQFKLPHWQIAKGTTDYKLQLQLPSDDRHSELQVESTLMGVSLELPGTLAKLRDQHRDLSLNFDLANADKLPITVNYDNQLKAALLFDTKQLVIESGQVLVGTGNVTKSEQPGITLELKREHLVLQDWLGLGASLLQTKSNVSKADAQGIKTITVHTEHGLWKNKDLGAMDVLIKPDGAFWIGDINGALAKGRFKIPVDLSGVDSINLTLDSLDLTVLKELKAQSDESKVTHTVLKSEPPPEVMPLIALSSQKTLWQSVDLGQLTVQTGRVANGIVFNRIELAGEDVKLNMTGDWLVTGKHSNTRLQGHLNVPRTGRLLEKLGITKNIRESSANIDIIGAWAGAPYQFALEDWQGTVAVNVKGGRILGIEPGIGRILGILAVAQWLKRLQLDFSDVYQEGLSFNTVQGQMQVAEGKAVTDNLVIDAIAAKITLLGTTNLLEKTLDYRVVVVPKSADAVPIAGTIMGKIADLIGRSLTGKDQQGLFFGSEYLVQGDWDNAKIIPLADSDGLLQKTWHGITDFSWLPHNEEP